MAASLGLLLAGLLLSGGGCSKADEVVDLANTAIGPAQAQRIQNAADRIGKRSDVVGSRARGAPNPDDWDYVIEGLTKCEKDKIKNSLPGAPNRTEGTPSKFDFLETLDPSRPHITLFPRNFE